MRAVLSFILCAACIAIGCSKENTEPTASNTNTVVQTNVAVKKKEKVWRSFWFPEVSRQWVRTIGKDLPARIDNLPREKTESEKRVIKGMVDNLLEICTNRTENEVREIVRQLDEVTDGLGYNRCGEDFRELDCSFRHFSFNKIIEPLEQPPPNFSRSISNYCYLASMVADLCWTKAGRCFYAQRIDHGQFWKLNYLSKTCKKKKWDTVLPIVDQLKQEWLEKRFDAPDCHLRIACDEIGEDAELDKTGLDRPWSIRGRYDNTMIFYEVKAVGRYPKWLKGEVLDDQGNVFIPQTK